MINRGLRLHCFRGILIKLFRSITFYFVLGARKPFEAIYVSSKSRKPEVQDPLIVVLHGGPHTVLLASFAKSLAFLSSVGYSLLIVNYRYAIGKRLSFFFPIQIDYPNACVYMSYRK